MPLSIIPTAAVIGATATPATIETHVAPGLPGFTVVGSPDAATRETRDRVRAAILTSGLTWPNMRVTVNVVGADLAPCHDLPIALGILCASSGTPTIGAWGTLGLDGAVHATPGAVAAIEACGTMMTSPDVVGGIGVATLDDAWDILTGAAPAPDPTPAGFSGPIIPVDPSGWETLSAADRETCVVAALGRFSVLVTDREPERADAMARCIHALVQSTATPDERAAVRRIHDAAGACGTDTMRRPHHATTSVVGLLGGGTRTIRPGEASLAHGGVLMLDDLAEWPSATLDGIAAAMRAGAVNIARAHRSAALPAPTIVVGRAAPCACSLVPCRCSDAARSRYVRRISGPLRDTFTLRRPTATHTARSAGGMDWADAVALMRNVRAPAADCTAVDDAARGAMACGQLSARGAARAADVAGILGAVRRESTVTRRTARDAVAMVS